jgi:uncharacterized membrane protein
MASIYNRIAAGDVSRIAALSDGVFAFAATLLIVDIHIPDPLAVHGEADLVAALTATAPLFLTWLMSLMTLGIFWVGQQTQLNRLARADRDLTWLYLVFLAVITLLPFTTRLLATFFAYRAAFVVYWANIALAGAALYATWRYAERAGLINEPSTELSRAVVRRIVIAQSLYALGLLAGLIDVEIGVALVFLVQLNYAIAPRLPGLFKI